MASGELKPIVSVVVGDLVVASDPETGEQAAKPVEQAFVHEDVVFDLVIGDEVISTTEDHPFWSVTDDRFERADELEPGELVLSASGATVQVSATVSGSTRTAVAYNLAVEDIHTFHVGFGALLEHNTCPIPGADNTVDLFRHASPAEVADIGANGFRSTANSLEGKWFAETAEAATQWGGALNGGTGAIVQARVPGSFAAQLGRWPNLDGIGPARFVGPGQLGQLNQFPRGVI